MKKISLIIFCLIVFALPVSAVTLNDALKQTYENNLELKAEKIKLDQAQNNLSIVKSELKPSIQLSSDGLPKYVIGEGNNPKNPLRQLTTIIEIMNSWGLSGLTKRCPKFRDHISSRKHMEKPI